MASTDQPAVSPNRALWEKGDFTRIAAAMRESGESLVRSLDVHEGMDVLDLGCGDGTTAVPAAQLGASVLGVDIARNLVAAGNARVSGRHGLSPGLAQRHAIKGGSGKGIGHRHAGRIGARAPIPAAAADTQ